MLKILIWSLIQTITCFHYYVDASEVRCFVEELATDTTIVGGYKLLIFDTTSNQYVEQQGSSMSILVYPESTKIPLVDMKGSSKGKFRFTAAEHGAHKVCLTPMATGWYDVRSKVYLDLQYGGSQGREEQTKTDEISRIRD
jgi:hypothetical protein